MVLTFIPSMDNPETSHCFPFTGARCWIATSPCLSSERFSPKWLTSQPKVMTFPKWKVNTSLILKRTKGWKQRKKKMCFQRSDNPLICDIVNCHSQLPSQIFDSPSHCIMGFVVLTLHKPFNFFCTCTAKKQWCGTKGLKRSECIVDSSVALRCFYVRCCIVVEWIWRNNNNYDLRFVVKCWQ